MQANVDPDWCLVKVARQSVVLFIAVIMLVPAQIGAASGPAISGTEDSKDTLAAYGALQFGSLPLFQKLVRSTESASAHVQRAPLLYWTIAHKKPKHLAHLLSFGDPTTLSGLTDMQLLSAAIDIDFLEGLKLLIEAGTDINASNEKGEPSALIQAVSKENEAIVSYLISQGADLNRSVPSGYTPLTLALFLKNEDITRLLVKSGALTTIKGAGGLTAEDLARENNVAQWLGIPEVPAIAPSKSRKYGPSPAANYITLVTEEGRLVAARGVRIGDQNTEYDVVFLNECQASRSPDDRSAPVFVFTSASAAQAASVALRDKVFVDGDMGTFDSNPGLTNPCLDGESECAIATPFEVIGKSIRVFAFMNGSGTDGRNTISEERIIRCSLRKARNVVYAVWMPSRRSNAADSVVDPSPSK